MVAANSAVRDRDPDEILTVEDAHRFLGIGRSTLYRLDRLRRVRLSPGRVGYRLGDLLEHQRCGFDDASPLSAMTDCWVDDVGGEILAEHLAKWAARMSTLVRLRPRRKDASLAFSIELPCAREWRRDGHREFVVIDLDGLNAQEPTVLIAQEGEELRQSGELKPRQRLMVTTPHAITRLTPLFGWPEKMADGWIVD